MAGYIGGGRDRLLCGKLWEMAHRSLVLLRVLPLSFVTYLEESGHIVSVLQLADKFSLNAVLKCSAPLWPLWS